MSISKEGSSQVTW